MPRLLYIIEKKDQRQGIYSILIYVMDFIIELIQNIHGNLVLNRE